MGHVILCIKRQSVSFSLCETMFKLSFALHIKRMYYCLHLRAIKAHSVNASGSAVYDIIFGEHVSLTSIKTADFVKKMQLLIIKHGFPKIKQKFYHSYWH